MATFLPTGARRRQKQTWQRWETSSLLVAPSDNYDVCTSAASSVLRAPGPRARESRHGRALCSKTRPAWGSCLRRPRGLVGHMLTGVSGPVKMLGGGI